MLSSASPNFWTSRNMVDDTVDAPAIMDNRLSPQDDPVSVQSDEDQFGDLESTTEMGDETRDDTGDETRWNLPLFVLFVSFCAGVAIALHRRK